MACAGKGYGTNPSSDQYLYSQFYTNQTISITPKTSRKCRKFNGFYPSFTPILSGLSVDTSPAGTYSLVYITGSNFLPNNTTFIKFGSYGYLPVIYYSSFNLSFVVPSNAISGNYAVQVVNLYNGNFSPPTNQSYNGNLNYSASINYTIT